VEVDGVELFGNSNGRGVDRTKTSSFKGNPRPSKKRAALLSSHNARGSFGRWLQLKGGPSSKSDSTFLLSAPSGNRKRLRRKNPSRDDGGRLLAID